MKLTLSAFILFSLLAGPRAHADSRIINGVPVPSGHFTEVIEIDTNGSHCTATIAGPRVVVTAGHCAKNGAKVKFEVQGKTYVGVAYTHPLFAGQDMDLALVITPNDIENVMPIHIGEGVKIDQDIFLLGYGCTNPGGGGGNDGVLRIGSSTVLGFSNNDFISKRTDGAALCFGDSGGPTYIKVGDRYRLVGVSSKGNIQDTNYSIYLALPEARRFLEKTALEQKVKICGVNSTCEEPLAVGAPQFKEGVINVSLSSTSAMVVELSNYLKTQVEGVRWTLDPKAPDWISLYEDSLGLCPPMDLSGTFRFSLTAQNEYGAAAAMIVLNLTAPTASPKCTLTAHPQFVTLGEALKLRLVADQVVDSASIDGVEFPHLGTDLVIFPNASGVFLAKGEVTGPSGTGHCTVRYAVK